MSAPLVVGIVLIIIFIACMEFMVFYPLRKITRDRNRYLPPRHHGYKPGFPQNSVAPKRNPNPPRPPKGPGGGSKK